MERAISTINQFDFSKAQINNFVEKVLIEIDKVNPLEIMPKLKVMEEIVKQLKGKINHNLMMEVETYPEKTFDFAGCKFTKVTRKSYDYSDSDVWNHKKTEIDDLQKLMQTIKTPVADTKTGELIYPAKFKVSESVSITLPKE